MLEYTSANKVSIRSPRRSEGRSRPASLRSTVVVQFQSAPPAEARGDLSCAVDAFDHEEVSIRSPRRSEGRFPRPNRRGRKSTVSIRSPRRSEGRCIPLQNMPAVSQAVSIRSPRRSEGRSTCLPSCTTRPIRGVSIRSPRRSEGRCIFYDIRDPQGRSFNPLPPPKRGEIGGTT